MESVLKQTQMNTYTKVFAGTFSREETAESVVPDMLPDMLRILDATGIMTIRSKEVMQGKLTVSGNASILVMYEPESSDGVRSLSLSIPYNADFDCAELTDECVPVAELSLKNVDARMLNPRKVLVRADVCAVVSSYRADAITLYSSAAESDGSVLTLEKEVTVNSISAVREKTFVITDEYPVLGFRPSSGGVVAHHLSTSVDDVKTVGNKVIFKGTATQNFTCLNAGGHTPSALEFSTSFSQIIEMDEIGEAPDCEVMLVPTGTYSEIAEQESGSASITTELHYVAQVICRKEALCVFTADAFSNKHEIRLEYNKLSLCTFRRTVSLRESLREFMPLPDNISDVISAYAVAGIPECEQSSVTVPVNVHLLYRSEAGRISSAVRRFQVSSTVETEPGMRIDSAGACCSTVHAAAVDGGAEVRVPADITVTVLKEEDIDNLSAIEIEEDSLRDRSQLPSVVIIRPTENMSAWELAKKYSSTPELIAAVNGTESEREGGSAVLLIPKAR